MHYLNSLLMATALIGFVACSTDSDSKKPEPGPEPLSAPTVDSNSIETIQDDNGNSVGLKLTETLSDGSTQDYSYMNDHQFFINRIDSGQTLFVSVDDLAINASDEEKAEILKKEYTLAVHITEMETEDANGNTVQTRVADVLKVAMNVVAKARVKFLQSPRTISFNIEQEILSEGTPIDLPEDYE